MRDPKISRNSIGISGEFYIAYILAKNGFKVNVSLGRTEGFDLFLQNPLGTNITVSVKTTFSNTAKKIVMTEKAETLIDDYLYYAFVRLNAPDGVPDFWIVPSKIVAEVIKQNHQSWLKETSKNGKPHKDSKMRGFSLVQKHGFPNDWEKQLESFKSNIKSLTELK
ncbi:MAG: hypothetical protein ACFFDF_17095 [Candidatus Odinarchaeota archaeon]